MDEVNGLRALGALATVLLALLVVLGVPCEARAGADAHGAVPLADDGDPADPILSMRAQRQVPGIWSLGGAFEFARAPLYRVIQYADGTDTTVLLGDFFAWNLGATYGITQRVGLGVTLPVFFASGEEDGVDGPGFGDLHLAVPVGLVLPDEEGRGFGLALVPVLRVPTGAEGRFIGDPAFGGALRVVAGYGAGRVGVSADAGLDLHGYTDVDTLSGGLQGSFAVAGAWRVAGNTALHLELRGATPPNDGGALPVEGLLGARGRASSGLWWSLGLVRGFTSGVSASELRVFAGIGYTRPVREAGAVPVPASQFRFEVVDLDGAPVPAAVVRAGRRELGRTDAAGALVVDRVRWGDGVTVVHAGYLEAAVDKPEGDLARVVLDFSPVPVRFRIQDQEGSPVAADLSFTGPRPRPPTKAGPFGVADVDLPPGDWYIEVVAPGASRQARDVRVPRGSRPLEVDVILTPDAGGDSILVLRVTDPQDQPLSDVRVRLDGQPLGATGSGGTIEVGALQPGPHQVEVVADAYQALELEGMVLSPGRNAFSIPLKRVPGGVKVIARGPEGPVPDAVVRFDGPARLPPQALGEDGERIVQVRPGRWNVLVVSPSWGMQLREVVVPPDRTALTVVEVVMQPSEGGGAELALRIVDPDGAPIEGAEVFLDGRVYGTSASGGTVTLTDLNEGPRTLEVKGRRFRPLEPLDVFLTEGLQEQVVTLEWLPGTVKVVARTPDGEVDDGVVRFSGPGSVPPLVLGPHGEAFVTLEPGRWQLLVTSATWGLQQRDLVVPEDSRSLLLVDVVFGSVERGDADLVLTVLQPDGMPVNGAAVYLDGNPLGATSTGGTLRLAEVREGRRQLRVVAPLFQPATRSVTLAAGEQSLQIPLQWAPGAVKVVARDEEGPVADAVIRFAGPSVYPPVRVDHNGERLVALSPGSWQGLAASATHGLQERRVEISPDQRDLVVVEFLMSRLAVGRAELLVRVVDPNGDPVRGATVSLDGEPRGTTAGAGAVLISDLDPGKVSFEVHAPTFRPAVVDGFRLREGSQERLVELRWVPATVAVSVKDTNGAPVHARVQAEGPEDVAGAETDAAGQAVLEVPPGTWQVVVTAGALGTQSRTLEVRPGADVPPLVFELQAARVDLTTQQVVIREKVHFDFDQATLQPESAAILAEVAATILSQPRIVRVEVQGHTDNTGGAAYNLDLSERRAQAVVDALVARGVAPERLDARGYGFTRPVASNETEDGKAQNRRVQFEILEWANR